MSSLKKEYKKHYSAITNLLYTKNLNYYSYSDADDELFDYLWKCQVENKKVEDYDVILERISTGRLEQTKTERWMSYLFLPLLFSIFVLFVNLLQKDYIISTHYICAFVVVSIYMDIIFFCKQRFNILKHILFFVFVACFMIYVFPYIPYRSIKLSKTTIVVLMMLACVFLLCIRNHIKRNYVDWKNRL